jgi:hypothetical protein
MTGVNPGRSAIALIGFGLLAMAPGARAQSQVEVVSPTPEPKKGFEIVVPGPSSRELTRPRDLEFYGEDQRVPYNPAFIEPFTGSTKGGTRYGVSAYTAPQTPVGPLSATNPLVGMGWFSLGFTVIWDTETPEALKPAGAPR